MYYTIVFSDEIVVDLEVSRKQRLERLVIHKGTRLQAQIRPYVLDTEDGPIEMADLFFEDGTATRLVPFAFFSFAD